MTITQSVEVSSASGSEVEFVGPGGLSRQDLESGAVVKLIAREALAGSILSDADLRTSLEATLLGAGEDIWVFGYGSLVWNPIFPVAERRVVRISGYHRSFCLRSTVGRGSPETPGLMLGLDRGGASMGVARRMERESLDAELTLLWRREMAVGSYMAKWLRAAGPDGDIRVLAFVADRRAANYVGGLPEDETARMLSTGSGFLGTSFDYLLRTHDGLAAHGISDRRLKRLVRLCRQIR